MPQALIQVNGVDGSNDNLPINTLVQLNNNGTGGEATYAWSIVSQPPGAVDALSSLVIINPTFTPLKEGTYLLQVIVNAGPLELIDRVIVAIRDLKTFERVPAPLEEDENDAAAGWAGDASGASRALRRALVAVADPGVFTALAGASGIEGYVVAATSTAVLKSGLPGAETMAVVNTALATSLNTASAALGYAFGTPSGAGAALNAPVYVRRFGLISPIDVGAMLVGDLVYLSDTGTLAAAPGTNSRVVGRVMVAGVSGAIYFDGAGGGGGGGGGGGAFNTVLTLVGTAVALNDLVICNSAIPKIAYAVTLPLVGALDVGKEIIIKSVGNNPTVTITPDVTQSVDGVANYVLAQANGAVHLVVADFGGGSYAWVII